MVLICVLSLCPLGSIIAESAGVATTPLLIIRPEGKDFEQAVEGLKGELSEDFVFTEMIFKKGLEQAELAAKIKSTSPKIIVLMDNRVISLYQSYAKNLQNQKNPIPTVSIMAVYMDIAIKGLKNATGIYYEVPVVTSLVNLRSITNTSFKRVGIVHRDIIDSFIEKNRNYCAKEGIELIPYPIAEGKNIESELKKGLYQLKKKGKIDVLWIPNDITLVNTDTLKNLWIPFVEKYNIPTVVGVEVLINPKLNLGTFCVVPAPYELGMQTAEIIFDAMDGEWQVEGREVEPPRSVHKIINLKQIKLWYDIDENMIQNVDKILK